MKRFKLWQKLFTRNDEVTEIALHVSGATVRHRSPFEELNTFRNQEELSEHFINQWVADFYLVKLTNKDPQVLQSFAKATREISIQDIKQLLGDFNWRSRIVGAYFAAIKNHTELEGIIGIHLLKSEVCYAGTGYALALALFRTDHSKEYLKKYLDYYLQRKDLWYDQAEVLAALYYLDPVEAETYTDNWLDYIADKPNKNLDKARGWFKENILAIRTIRQMAQEP